MIATAIKHYSELEEFKAFLDAVKDPIGKRPVFVYGPTVSSLDSLAAQHALVSYITRAETDNFISKRDVSDHLAWFTKRISVSDTIRPINHRSLANVESKPSIFILVGHNSLNNSVAKAHIERLSEKDRKGSTIIIIDNARVDPFDLLENFKSAQVKNICVYTSMCAGSCSSVVAWTIPDSVDLQEEISDMLALGIYAGTDKLRNAEEEEIYLFGTSYSGSIFPLLYTDTYLNTVSTEKARLLEMAYRQSVRCGYISVDCSISDLRSMDGVADKLIEREDCIIGIVGCYCTEEPSLRIDLSSRQDGPHVGRIANAFGGTGNEHRASIHIDLTDSTGKGDLHDILQSIGKLAIRAHNQPTKN